MKSKTSIVELFKSSKEEQKYLKVCAPMVRYSKAPFRKLVRNYGTDLCFSPMILADSFCQNAKARASEFSTTKYDTPLIVQFAANDVNDFIDATNLIFPYADGVDLNCGCPQSWAMKDGYGCALLSQPELVCDMVKGVRNTLSEQFSVSVKIRILSDLRKTIDMCQKFEKCGVTFLTVHGRTPSQKPGDSINTTALKEVCQLTNVPIIANGGIKSLEEANELYETVGCDAVMAASALLTNPALFSGPLKTPPSCVKHWMDIKNRYKNTMTFQCYHHHLVFMLEKVLTKIQKQTFNHLKTFETVDKYLFEHIIDSVEDVENIDLREEFVSVQFSDYITSKHANKCRGCGKSKCYCNCQEEYDSNAADGSFFISHVNKTGCDVDLTDCNIFDIT